jgi:rhodanese-related sulfurtransferase
MKRPAGRSARPRRWIVPCLVLLLLLAGCSYLRKRQAKRPPYRKLSPPVAFEMIRDNPTMLVLDLRSPQEFTGETGHLRQARNIPLEALPYRHLDIAPFREDTFLVYCRADDCGEKGMTILLAFGYEDAVLMEGGIDQWIRDGFKTVLPQDAAGKRPQEGKGPVMPLRPQEQEPKPEPTPPPPILLLQGEPS